MIIKHNQLEFKHLRYFLVLAEVLHFRKAAAQLLISQSSLSQYIAQLEEVMGQSLFHRTNRKVELSTAGYLLKKEAVLIMGQLETSLERWSLAIEGVAGLLKIGFVGSAMYGYLPPLLKDFGEKHPLIRFRLAEATNQEQIKGIELDTIDLGFIRSNRVSNFMNIKLVYKECFSLVVPEDHKITTSNFEGMHQLATEDFILFPNNSSQRYFQQIMSMCTDAGFSPRITHEAIHAPTIFKLIENNMGISVVPSSLQDKGNYKVRFIDLKNITQQTELYAVWKKENTNPALKNLVSLL